MTLADLEALGEAGLEGWVAGAGWIAASFLSGAVAYRTVRWHGRSSAKLTTIAMACLGASVAGCAFVLVRGRQRMLAIALGSEGPAREQPNWGPLGWLGSMEATESALFVAGVGIAVCGSLFALCAIISAARASERVSRPAGWSLGIVTRLTLAGLAVAMGLAATRVTAEPVACWAAYVWPTERLQAWASTVAAALADARTHIVGVAVFGWVAGALGSRRAREPQWRWRGAIGGGLVFVVGVAAFAATRPMAYDVGRPIPNNSERGCPVVGVEARTLPVMPRGEPQPEGLRLELYPGEARLADSLGPTGSPAELDERLRRQRDLWFGVVRRPTGARPHLLVVAPATLPMAEAAIWLRAIEGHLVRGFTVVVIVVESGRRFSTRTLGELTERSVCSGIPLRIDPVGRLLTSYPTWGDLLSAHADTTGPLGIRLR